MTWVCLCILFLDQNQLVDLSIVPTWESLFSSQPFHQFLAQVLLHCLTHWIYLALFSIIRKLARSLSQSSSPWIASRRHAWPFCESVRWCSSRRTKLNAKDQQTCQRWRILPFRKLCRFCHQVSTNFRSTLSYLLLLFIPFHQAVSRLPVLGF